MRRTQRNVLVGIGVLIAACAFGQAPPQPAVGGNPADQTAVRPALISKAPPPVAPSVSAPQPIGYESDVYCFGYLGDYNETFPVRVVSAESLAEQIDYIAGDLLYVDGGYDKGLRVGDIYWLVTPEQEVFNPATGQSLGRLFQQRGRAAVYSVEPRTAILRVVHSCTDIPLGAGLKKFDPIPIPLARKSPPSVAGDPPSGKATGHIIFTRDGVVALGADADVIVDLGLANGLSPGDFLTVYRYSTGRSYGVTPLGTYWVNLPPPPGSSVPRTYLGEAAVLVVGDRWSVVRLTDSYRLIEVGDEVEIK
jgi:hypothetical protein